MTPAHRAGSGSQKMRGGLTAYFRPFSPSLNMYLMAGL
jgi:hypothetical protein